MKNLYFLLLLTISISYNVSALERSKEELSKQTRATTNEQNNLPYAQVAKDGEIGNKEVVNKGTGIGDGDKEVKNKDIWNENKDKKNGKEVEGTDDKTIEDKEYIDDKEVKDERYGDRKDDTETIEDNKNEDKRKDNKKIKNEKYVDKKDDEKIEDNKSEDKKDSKRIEDEKNGDRKDEEGVEDQKVDQGANKINDSLAELKVLNDKRNKTSADENIIPYKQTQQATEQESVVNKRKSMDKRTMTGSKVDNNRLKKWKDLKKEPVREWPYQDTQDKPIHMKQYNDLNSHLPATVYVRDYSNQLFYCVGKNDTLCIRGIVNKLENIGFSIKEILDLRNNVGDTSLIYAARKGALDAVRFLLLQGADVNAVNNKFESALDIARRQDIINAITEMKPGTMEVKTISNRQNSDMYNWAMSAKENNEPQYNKK